MIKMILGICLLIPYYIYIYIIVHIQNKKIESLENKHRYYLQICIGQMELIEILNQEIKELKDNIYIDS